MARALLVTIAALCCLSLATAYPWLFVDEYAKTCTSHPNAPDGRHKAPVADSTTSIALFLNGAPTGSACPGSKYELKIKFPQARRAMVTTTIGTLANGLGDLPGKKCPNRMLNSLNTNQAASSVILTSWAVPCGATGEALVQVTSAIGSQGAFLQMSAKVAILANSNICRSCPRG